MFGPSAAHLGVVMANTAYTINFAFNLRMLIVRESLEKEVILRDNQASYLSKPSPLLFALADIFSYALREYLGWYVEAEQHHADPHAKRLLRMHAWNELHTDGGSGARLWLFNNCVNYKLKKDEIGKPNTPVFLNGVEHRTGVGRMIGDLGVSASLQGFRLTELLKNGMAKEAVVIGDARFQFCKRPSPGELQEVMDKLYSPPETHYFVYFSDDACYARRLPSGVVKRWNVDIKKCDASHTRAIFDKLIDLVPELWRDDMQILVDQCSADITIRSPDNSKHAVRLTPVDGQGRCPKLYSGSTLTTLLNNLANLTIGECLVRCASLDADSLIESVEECGYAISMNENELFEDVQFLKYSPVKDNHGRYRPLLNVGVMLRAIGQCKGDVPGRGPLVPRFRAFQKGLLNGLYPTTSFVLVNRMKEMVEDAVVTKATFSAVSRNLPYFTPEEGDRTHFLDEDVYRRYRLSREEIDRLNDELGDAGVGALHDSSGSRAIFSKDYEL